MSTRIAKPNRKLAENIVNDWNSKHLVGTLVEVTKDDGSIEETLTASEAWVLGGHTAVIQLVGISGCYALSRVRPQRLNADLSDRAGDGGRA